MTLMLRTARRLDLTEECSWLLARARSVISELEDTEAQVAARRSQPSGRVRVNASTPAFNHLVAPLAADFLDAYPLVRLEVTGGETVVALIAERGDMAIRIGPLADSTLNARRLGGSRVRLLASPDYLARQGAPRDAGDLTAHRLLGFTAPAWLNNWPLAHEGGEGMAINPALTATSGETLRHLALAGAGIARLSDFLTRDGVTAGALVPVMPELTMPWSEPVWAVFYKQGELAPRLAALVDFLAKRLGDGMLDD